MYDSICYTTPTGVAEVRVVLDCKETIDRGDYRDQSLGVRLDSLRDGKAEVDAFFDSMMGSKRLRGMNSRDGIVIESKNR